MDAKAKAKAAKFGLKAKALTSLPEPDNIYIFSEVH